MRPRKVKRETESRFAGGLRPCVKGEQASQQKGEGIRMQMRPVIRPRDPLATPVIECAMRRLRADSHRPAIADGLVAIYFARAGLAAESTSESPRTTPTVVRRRLWGQRGSGDDDPLHKLTICGRLIPCQHSLSRITGQIVFDSHRLESNLSFL